MILAAARRESMAGIGRRATVAGLSGTLAGTLAAGAWPRPARAAAPTKITFLTSWFAQAEHGGFYQAKATGLYEKAGLDVDIKMGGPQVNAMQLLTGGAADIIMGYDIQMLKAVENGLPVTTVATSFQFDLQGIMTHDDISSLAALKGHKVLIAASSHTTFWPWLKQHFGYTDEMAGVDTFNLQPFLVDKTLAVQAYPSSEPYEATKQGAKVKFFLFADDGYPPYGSTMVTTNAFIDKHPEATQAFVRCSLEGWADYFKNPAPANKLIQVDNPKMTDDRIAFAIQKMKEMQVLDRGEAAKTGIGTMTDARWKQTRDFLVQAELLKPTTDYKKAFTTRFTDGLHISA
jgi:NitT/TauT family transport system substrate-binding protein